MFKRNFDASLGIYVSHQDIRKTITMPNPKAHINKVTARVRTIVPMQSRQAHTAAPGARFEHSPVEASVMGGDAKAAAPNGRLNLGPGIGGTELPSTPCHT